MPVRFRCHGCQRVLNALERKIGEEVNCPGCGALLIVPPSDTVPAPPDAPQSDVVAAAASPSSAAPRVAESSASSGGVYVSRRILYAQAVLLAVAAFGFFIAGYFIGRGNDNPTPGDATPRTIAFAGHIKSVALGDPTAPEPGAAVLILPAERKPRRDAKIDAAMLHPLEPLPAADDPVLSNVEALGGAYARTDDAGSFRVSLPQQGRYHVLVVSRQLQRTSYEPNRVDLATLGEYVVDALALVSGQQYVLQSTDLTDGGSFEYAFRD